MTVDELIQKLEYLKNDGYLESNSEIYILTEDNNPIKLNGIVAPNVKILNNIEYPVGYVTGISKKY